MDAPAPPLTQPAPRPLPCACLTWRGGMVRYDGACSRCRKGALKP